MQKKFIKWLKIAAISSLLDVFFTFYCTRVDANDVEDLKQAVSSVFDEKYTKTVSGLLTSNKTSSPAEVENLMHNISQMDESTQKRVFRATYKVNDWTTKIWNERFAAYVTIWCHDYQKAGGESKRLYPNENWAEIYGTSRNALHHQEEAIADFIYHDNVEKLRKSCINIDVTKPLSTKELKVIAADTPQPSLPLNAQITLLDIATLTGAQNCFNYLHVSKKAQITPTTFCCAIAGGNIASIRYIYNELKSKERVFDFEHAESAVKIAIEFHRKYILQWLFQIKSPSENLLCTALCYSLELGCVDTFLTIVDNCGPALVLMAFPESEQKVETILHAAARVGDDPLIVSILKTDFGKSLINFQDGLGVTVLHRYAFIGHVEVVELLLAKGAQVDIKDCHGGTVLHWAAAGGNAKAISLLLKSGTNINAKDFLGRSVLHEAVRDGSVQIVKLLLEQGVDINARDSLGYTALKLAIEAGHSKVIELLQAKSGQV